jgi:hypothetical protein
MPNDARATGQAKAPFPGFELPTANFIYCPNQFFDVCLPHCSRGAVRFIAYLLRRTLGWLDAPFEDDYFQGFDMIGDARVWVGYGACKNHQKSPRDFG